MAISIYHPFGYIVDHSKVQDGQVQWKYSSINWLRPGTTFPTRVHVRAAKSQIRLRIRAVWSKSSQGTVWVAKDQKRLSADSEDSDQPARMIWVFAVRKFNRVGNTVPRLVTVQTRSSAIIRTTYSSVCPFLSSVFPTPSIHLNMDAINYVEKVINNCHPLVFLYLFFTTLIILKLTSYMRSVSQKHICEQRKPDSACIKGSLGVRDSQKLSRDFQKSMPGSLGLPALKDI